MVTPNATVAMVKIVASVLASMMFDFRRMFAVIRASATPMTGLLFAADTSSRMTAAPASTVVETT